MDIIEWLGLLFIKDYNPKEKEKYKFKHYTLTVEPK